MRVYFHTFGCKTNQYDTEAVRQSLEAAGASAVAHPDMADVAVVNSCTVTHTGEAKMRRFVRRLRRERPELQTVIMGCAATVDDGVLASLPGVAAVVAGSDPRDILDALGFDATPVDPILRSFPRGTRAWLKIQDGCDEHCTFCATTIARGANRSRATDEIIQEAGVLAANHQEIVLTGVHIGTYGKDLGDGSSLGRLVERLISEVEGPRFRLSSVEATEVDERLVDLMSDAPHRLASHLHAPLQSGSDVILKRMGRHWYTAAAYRERCLALAARVPALGLGADVIVGFPGESDDDHAATRSVIESLPFTYLHVFPYSQRPGASAKRMGGVVDAKVTASRSAELRELADGKGAAYRSQRDGGRADVVVLRRHKGRVQGLTEDFLDVYLAADREYPPRFSAVLRRGADGAMMAESV